MSVRDHSTIEELLAVQALGALDGDDRSRLADERAAHGDCEECRRLERDLNETAGRLAFALEPEQIDPSMAERILDADRRRRGERRRWGVLVAVATAVVLAVGAFAVYFAPGGTTPVTTTPGQRFVSFVPAKGAPGELAMAYAPGQPGAIVWGTGLSAPATGDVYEIWMITGDQPPVSGGCVVPSDGSVATYVNANVAGVDLMAVTQESQDCPSAPTTPPVYTAQLSA
jgi:anti-sigma-K factor RskA